MVYPDGMKIKQLADVRARITELEAFAADLEVAQSRLHGDDLPDVCDPDLYCCAPDVAIEIGASVR